MPEISVFGDVDEVDNRYIGKFVVYVEGHDDRNVWERVVGSELADRLEFKVPLAEGAGSDAVLNRVSEERSRNSKIFGLVDGEVAARFGEVLRLVNCSDVLFQLQISTCEGILFLGAHEMENILAGYSGLSEFMEYNVEIKKLDERRRDEAEKYILKQTKRFFVAALIKYTWAQMYFQEKTTGIRNVDHFRSQRDLTQEIRTAKEYIKQEFQDEGQEFKEQFIQIGRSVKIRLDNVRKDGGSTDKERVRLMDGKGFLIQLRSEWRFKKANEGLLVKHLVDSEFALKFRESLVKVTGV